ncbi:MAG: hypothetical protein FWF87_03770 [Synergistaceae bacterium]|nr:hypothetical protein [Synergistaceae bacterium]
MRQMLWSNSVRLWRGDNKTKLFPFDFHSNREGKGDLSEIEYRLSKKLSSGSCEDVSRGSYTVNIDKLSEDGILKYPADEFSEALKEKEELILFMHMRYKE